MNTVCRADSCGKCPGFANVERMMKIRWIIPLAGIALLFCLAPSSRAAAPPEPPAAPVAPFQQALERIGQSAGSAGVLLVELPSGRTVCELRSREQFVPASLVKILTGYAALKKLGPSFRFATEVYATAPPSAGGVLDGNIWVKGSGDPYFVAEKAALLAAAIRDRGIREIRGAVLADDSFFDPPSERICLDVDCTAAYNPLVSAAAFDFNMLTVRVSLPKKPAKGVMIDSSPPGYARVTGQPSAGKKGGDTLRVRSLGATGNGQEQFQLSGQWAGRGAKAREFRFLPADPAAGFGHAVRAALERSGVRVHGGARRGLAPADAHVIAVYDSPPLVEIVSLMNKYSNNFMAEMLLRSLGGWVGGTPGNSAKGISVIRDALGEAGIPDERGVLDCGSGLSRFCRLSPTTFNLLLQAAWRDPSIKADFVTALAANAEEGTLRRRMRKPGLSVRGKTGTLSDVVAFAGYVSGPSGKTYAAVVMMNDVRDRPRARQAIDSFLEEAAFSSP
ncbi:MAG: D-alanyl-D-alanine carboxypeptidase/D-alanyl-D-alanine-endopeptidase [Desulfobacteraceae bacterium]|nr:D-alanyl-D-alanine carboxypeptidase/D-alanyl-D-alanine-endopeptidase [Desulfobacteraceae bacterium]